MTAPIEACHQAVGARARIVGKWWNRFGVTREVITIGRYAIKIPKLTYGWKMFLCGLLANMQEREFSTLHL